MTENAKSQKAEQADGTSPALVYQACLDEGLFRIQKCESCNRFIFHPRLICPHCGSGGPVWVVPSGYGVVYATTVIHQPAEKGGEYNLALIDLDEGVRMMSRVEGIAPNQVSIKMRVKAHIVVENGHGLVVFQPTETPS